MARDFIKIDTTVVTATHAARLLSYKDALRTAYDQGKRLQAVMNHNTDGTVFTDIEALFGLPVGKGQTVYNLVTGSVGAIEGTTQSADGRNLTEQLG